ncbi:MAG: triose-phosphate isomerase [Patescibacteria group bacterium]|nr:triose-phosphate isomerase [Patescibacteria group bacterium]
MLYVANWKMNPPSLNDAKRLLKNIRTGINTGVKDKKTQIIICPPAIFLTKLGRPSSLIKFGIQNIGSKERGAFTGEISVLMAADANVEYCLVNHSERKLYFNETTRDANQKIKLCLEKRITPIFCIGESQKQFKKGKTKPALENQLKQGLKDIGIMNIKKVILAYEPLWAISSQKGAKAENPDQILGINILIRKILFGLYDQKIARETKILYGGSVAPKNAALYVKNKSIDGFLIGSASLNSFSFLNIIKNCQKN